MATDVGIKVQVDGEKTFKTAIQAINQQTKELNAEMKSAMAGMSGLTSSEEKVAAETKALSDIIGKSKEKVAVLSQQYDTARQRLDQLNNELQEAKAKGSDNVAEIQKAENAYNRQAAEVAKLGTQLANTNTTIKESEARLKELSQSANTSAEKLKSAGQKMKDFGTSLKSVGSSLTKIGSTLTRYVTTSITAAATAAVKMASDYEENLNKVDASFKDNAKEVKDWAKTATKSFGLSESAALDATSQFGDMGTSMGLTTKEAAQMSISLAGLAGDLASFKNISVEQSMTALKGIFTGETEALKTLGIVMTQTNLKQFASDMGLVYDSMSQAEKVTLRYQYVLEHTKNAQGDYERTAQGTANSLRTLKSSVENLGAAFGEELLPAITPYVNKLTEAIQKFGELSSEQKKTVINLGLVAAAIGPATTALGKLASGIGAFATTAGSVVSTLAGGGGLAAALTALGPGAAAGIAIAGLAAATVGSIALGNAIDGAIDPVKRLKKTLEDIQNAQKTVANSNEIIDLADRYQKLKTQLNDTTLSEEQHEQVAAELRDVLEQLSKATDGAVTATENLGDATDTQVENAKELAQIEKERANADIYANLLKEADKYSEAMLDQKRLTQEVEDAEEHLGATRENLTGDAASQLEHLQDVLEDTQDKLAEGIINTDTVDGANELREILDGLEDSLYDLTGTKVHFDGLADAQAYFEDLSISTEDSADAALGASDNYEVLVSELEKANSATSEFERTVSTLVQDGFISAEQGAELLGISVEGLERKMSQYEHETTLAMAANGEFGTSMEDVSDAVDEEAAALEEAAQKAAETHKSIMDIASSAIDARYSNDNLRDSYNELASQLDDLRDSGDEYDIMLAEQKLHLLDIAATNQELSNSFSGLVEASGYSLTQLSTWLIDNGLTADEWGNAVKSNTDGVVNKFQELNTSLDMTLEEMASNFEKNINAYANWNTNIQTLMDAAVASGSQAAVDFVNYMASMGVGAAEQVQMMVDNIDYTMDTFPPLMSDASYQGMFEFYNGMEGEKANVQDAAEDVADAAIDGLENGDFKGTGKDRANDFTDGFESVDATPAGETVAGDSISGLKNKQQEMKQASQMLAHGAVDMMKSLAPLFRQAGVTIGVSLVQGYQAQLTSSRNAAYTMGQNMINAAKALASQFRQTGMLLAQTMIQGINSTANQFRQSGTISGQSFTAGLNSISSSARSAAHTLAANCSAAMSSLSYSFRSAGYADGSSFVNGIYSAAGSAASAGRYVANSALKSSYISGWYNVGYNAASGIASGLYGGSYMISSAARYAARQAYYAACSALGINSPSKLFRDKVGLMIGAGIAEGIKASEKNVTSAVDSLALNAVNAVDSNMGIGMNGNSLKNATYNMTPTIYIYGAEGQNVDELAAVVEQRINQSLIRRF